MSMIDNSGAKEKSATRVAYLTLREMILVGTLPPGEKLKIEQLRTLLRTGASPVREALSLLTSDMLVERIDQRGFRAAPASLVNFEEILTLRETLEDMALRKSIARGGSQWEERLVLSHHRMKRVAGTESFEDAHKSFHMGFWKTLSLLCLNGIAVSFTTSTFATATLQRGARIIKIAIFRPSMLRFWKPLSTATLTLLQKHYSSTID